jgi:hypothetical protein
MFYHGISRIFVVSKDTHSLIRRQIVLGIFGIKEID